jgi:4a-hydroxytetrahydrobiopterin dehydratase
VRGATYSVRITGDATTGQDGGMADDAPEANEELTRQQASEAVTDLGWRYVLGVLTTSVPVESLSQAVGVGAQVIAAAGEDADGHLRMDLRAGRVDLTVQSLATATVTRQDAILARRISEAVSGLGLQTVLGTEATRAVQVVEIAIDAMNIAAIRPFWKAVMGYADEAGRSGAEDPLVDPVWQSPAIWFQQMDAPRAQRNRIHFDVSVPHDEAQRRVRAALDAGGVLRSDAQAPAFWVLADAEGNEACVTTWQGRDP